MEAERIRLRLQALAPRSTRALTLRLLKGLSRSECASFYGISPQAFDLMFLRAAREYQGEPQGALPFETESRQATLLSQALEQGATATAELAPLAERLREVSRLAREVSQRIEEAWRVEEASPRRRREDWIRRALILAVVALALFFYWREKR